MTRARGFTLIELMIVVAIIGLVATIAIGRYDAAVDKARQAKVVMFMNTAFKQIKEFYIQNGYYPADVYPDEQPPGLVPRYMPTWSTSADLPFNSQTDYEAWPLGNGKYWIGITWFGKNGVREGGTEAGSQYVQKGIPGQIQSIGDDLYLTIAVDGRVGP